MDQFNSFINIIIFCIIFLLLFMKLTNLWILLKYGPERWTHEHSQEKPGYSILEYGKEVGFVPYSEIADSIEKDAHQKRVMSSSLAKEVFKKIINNNKN